MDNNKIDIKDESLMNCALNGWKIKITFVLIEEVNLIEEDARKFWEEKIEKLKNLEKGKNDEEED